MREIAEAIEDVKRMNSIAKNRSLPKVTKKKEKKTFEKTISSFNALIIEFDYNHISRKSEINEISFTVDGYVDKTKDLLPQIRVTKIPEETSTGLEDIKNQIIDKNVYLDRIEQLDYINDNFIFIYASEKEITKENRLASYKLIFDFMSDTMKCSIDFIINRHASGMEVLYEKTRELYNPETKSK